MCKKAVIKSIFFGVFIYTITACVSKPISETPKPFGATPTAGQKQWHNMETYAFLHFTTNTFTDKEWGFGDEKPSVFNPTNFDANQIIETIANAGFKGAILTAKHHDGFCLWPSKYTEHSVKSSNWKDGKGDVVKEIAEACKKHNIKLGIYLSPWDRNYADYGNEKYVSYYQNQLTELLTNYGDIFIVWLDGANGGDGYYGGANESRKIDRSTYYQWENVIALVRKLQPKAVIFSDSGPDVRWVGNEKGFALDSCYATYTPLPYEAGTQPAPGNTMSKIGESGTKNGTYWMPAEVDVSIRPGWFYHQKEDGKVKTVAELLKIYFQSVGNGADLNLNIPPNREGKISKTDSIHLMGYKAYLDKAFANNLLKQCKINASSSWSKNYDINQVLNENNNSFWIAAKGNTKASITINLNKVAAFNCLILKEQIDLGQRIMRFKISVKTNAAWQEVANGYTVGYKKILRFPMQNAKEIKIDLEGEVEPTLSNLQLFNIPNF